MIRVLLVGACSTFLWVASAWAQDSSDGADGPDAAEGTEEIIVFGTKIERSLAEETSSVDVVTGAEIAREPVIDLYEIVDRIPNVNAALGQQGFVVRGVDQRGVGGSTLTVTVFVDDSPLGNQTTFFGPLDSWDLSQVEVYRGPQSTNFGRNSIAGAIYIRTQDPRFEWDTKARVEAGNNGILQGALAFGGPLLDDKLAFRLSASHRESDGFIFNTFLNEEADATEQTTTRLKFLFEPNDSLSIITTSSYTEHSAGEDILSATNGVPGALIDASEVNRTVAYNIPGSEGTETFIQAINAQLDISDTLSLTSITTYQDTDYFRIEDFQTDPNNPDDNPALALNRTGVDEVLTQELRLTYVGERFSGTLGAYYLDAEDGFNDSFTLTGAILDPSLDFLLLTREGDRKDEVRNKALFFDGEYQLTDKLDLLFGVRYDNEDQADNTLSRTFVANPEVIPFLPPVVQAQLGFLLGDVSPATDADYDAVLPKIGLRYRVNDNTNLGFVIQRAYRAGGSDVDFVTSGVIDYDPEYLTNYELSARTTLLNGRLSWNSNIYFSDYTDQQVTESFPPPVDAFGFTVNAGESELFGFETDATYRVSAALDVYGSLGYAHTEFIEFMDSDGTDFSGNRFPYAPEWSANLGVSYDGQSGLFGGVDVNYQSDQYANNFNVPEDLEGERILVNARFGYRINDTITVAAIARNLFDEDYFAFANRGVFGNENARLGDERTLVLRVDIDL
ncbi:MAG: TonB-dependent receptor [Pseudomonadota bacterium]